ncbi:MAG TPA: hypothetical protein VFI42_05750 [Thermomicrobiaceae bacterium]|nr:hypothetical protein [Thermomicrobiaceae bacterium]
MPSEQTSNPQVHAEHIRGMLNDTIRHIRADEQRVNDVQAKALFETTAEVLGGLVKAYDDYEQRRPAWRAE